MSIFGCVEDDDLEKTSKNTMKKPVEEYLHRVNMDNLVKELNLGSVEAVGAFVGLKNPKGAYYWAKDKASNGTRPSYNAVVKMLDNGATVETLFGVEYDKIHREFIVPSSIQDLLNAPEFLAGMKKIIDKLKKDDNF